MRSTLCSGAGVGTKNAPAPNKATPAPNAATPAPNRAMLAPNRAMPAPNEARPEAKQNTLAPKNLVTCNKMSASMEKRVGLY